MSNIDTKIDRAFHITILISIWVLLLMGITACCAFVFHLYESIQNDKKWEQCVERKFKE